MMICRCGHNESDHIHAEGQCPCVCENAGRICGCVDFRPTIEAVFCEGKLQKLRRVAQAAQPKRVAMVDGFPRRSRIDLLEPAEKAIFDAVQAVERMPPDVRLTKAVCLLQDAREAVADYVEAAQDAAGDHRQRHCCNRTLAEGHDPRCEAAQGQDAKEGK